MMQMGK